MKLKTTLGRTGVEVKCQHCDWARFTGNYDADRMAARRHAESRGHVVFGYVTRLIRWDGASDQQQQPPARGEDNG